MSFQRLTHMGICVSDLERSLRFYRDLLGCKEVGRLALEGESVATLNGMAECKVNAVYLERDGWRLELLEFPVPGWTGPQAPRPMNQLACAGLEAAGGGLLHATRLDLPGPTRVIMAFDPDGTRIELIESPGDPSALPGPVRPTGG